MLNIQDLYPTDEEISRITKRVYNAPADKTIAKFAVDNAVKKIVEELDSILASECPKYKDLAPIGRQAYRSAHIEEFVLALKNLINKS